MIIKTIIGCAVFAALGFAQSTVDGSMKVAGKTTKLTHIYAYAIEGFFDKKIDDTIVLLTDRELTPALVRDTYELGKMSEAGKVVFVRETINAKGQLVGFAQESDERAILRDLLENDDFGLGGGHALSLEKQIAEVAISAAPSEQNPQISIESFDNTETDLNFVIVQDPFPMILEQVSQFLKGR